jgi:NitT/TauT family transport system permease protein
VTSLRSVERRNAALLGVAGVGLVGAAWEAVKAVGNDKKLLGISTDDASMPHLRTVWRAFFEEDVRGQGQTVGRAVLNGSWFSFRLALGGFVVGVLLGMLLAMAMQRFRLVERAWLPYVVLSQTVPLIALAPLIAGWGGKLKLGPFEWTGWMSVVGMAAYLSFFPIAIGALRGLKSPKVQSVELMDTYAASWWQTLFKLRLPASIPHVLPAMKLAAAASVVGAVVSEISIGLKGGIGRLIIDYFQKASGDPSRVFTAFIGAALLGLVVAALVRLVEVFLTRNLGGGRRLGADA